MFGRRAKGVDQFSSLGDLVHVARQEDLQRLRGAEGPVPQEMLDVEKGRTPCVGVNVLLMGARSLEIFDCEAVFRPLAAVFSLSLSILSSSRF